MHNKKSQIRRARRVRASLSGSAGRPRLSIHLSNLNITAQIIDDAKDSTLVYVSTVGRKLDGNMTQKAALVGEEIATAAKAAKIKKVVFDRGSKRYHGRIKTLADAARAKGLEF
ncbi:50S ribosomal protein L18 [Candidatus Saccharibacteria bacterium]|nr:50S ribosomal protein L18 [Candidatus Saccharibacteria bacterium]